MGRFLCFNLLAHGHVMSVKGIKRYQETNLSVTLAAMLRSTLPAAVSAALLVIRGQRGPGQEPSSHHSPQTSSTCLLWLYFSLFGSFFPARLQQESCLL